MTDIPQPSEEIVGFIQTDKGELIPVLAIDVVVAESIIDEETDDDSEPIE